MAPSRRSLLAEMAWRFVGPREVLATSGLGYVLRISPTARDALRTWLAERGVAIPPDLAYATEVIDPEQEGRPDVVGAVGKKRYLIIEGKFWASLTDNQPVGYLHSLEDGGSLLVVAPEQRSRDERSHLASPLYGQQTYWLTATSRPTTKRPPKPT